MPSLLADLDQFSEWAADVAPISLKFNGITGTGASLSDFPILFTAFSSATTFHQTLQNTNTDAVTGGRAMQMLKSAGSNLASFADAEIAFATAVGVTGDTTITGDTSVTGTFDVTGNSTLTGTLLVTGATELQSTLVVGSNATVGGTLNVAGATTLSSTLRVDGNATFGGTLTVDGATTLSSTLRVDGNATVGGTLNVAGNATLASSLAVTGTTTIQGLFSVDSSATLGNATTDTHLVNGILTVLNGPIYMGTATNATNTAGLTLNQLAADDEILSFKSSDVAHGMTGITGTDTYGYLKKTSPTLGGLRMFGLAEGSAEVGLRLDAAAGADNTARSTAATGKCTLHAFTNSGSSVAAVGADGNLFCVTNNGSAQFLVDAEGDIHMNGTTNNTSWDRHDDLALLETYRVLTAPGVEKSFRQRFAEDIAEHAEVLARSGVVTRNPDGSTFVSWKGMTALLIDSIRMLAADLREARAALRALEEGRGC